MGDMAELRELVAQQSRNAVAAQKRVDDLIAELARARVAAVPAAPAHHPPDAAAAARADKVSKLGIALRKS